MARFAIPEGVRLIALVQSPQVARRILRHLGLRDHAPPITTGASPSRAVAMALDVDASDASDTQLAARE